MKSELIAAIGTVLIVSSIDGVVAGGNLRAKMAAFRQPRVSPPFFIWAAAQWLYYGLCAASAYRIAAAAGPWRTITALVFGVVIACNAAWNLAFFRRRDLKHAWRVSIPYVISALLVGGIFLQTDPTLAGLFGLYAAFLAFGVWWSYSVWQLNKST